MPSCFSIDCTVLSGMAASSAATSARNAGMSAVGSFVVRMWMAMPASQCCACAKYMNAVGASPSRWYLPVGTTPMTVCSPPRLFTTLPMGSLPPKKWSTNRWLTTITRRPALSSCASNARPFTGMPIAAK